MVINKLILSLTLITLFLLQSTNSMVVCPPNKFINPQGTSCADCTTATDAVCGHIDYTCQFYYWTGSQCLSCSTIANTDSSKVNSDPSLCACQDQYFWQTSSSTCVACTSTSDEVSCGLCNNIFDLISSTCQPCSNFANTDSSFIAQTGSCGCLAGYTWDSTSLSCDLCNDATVDAIKCGRSSCISFFWTGSVCQQCSDLPNTDPNINNKVFGLNQCACLKGFTWSQGACVACTDVSITQQLCTTPSCSAYVWTGVACGDCSAIVNADPTKLPVNGLCTCNQGFFWSVADSVCADCSTVTNEDECALCKGFIYSEQACKKCSDVPNTYIAYGQFANKGNCYCDLDFYWDTQTNTCIPCDEAFSEQNCGVGSCMNFFIKTGITKSCARCSGDLIQNTVPKSPTTGANACTCSAGFIWSAVESNCIACDVASGYILVNPATGQCTNCNSKQNAKQDQDYSESKSKSGMKCACKANYSLINNGCGCKKQKKQFDLGHSRGCGPCSLIPGGLKYNQKNSTCSCIIGATWNKDLSACVCPSPSFMPLSGKGCVTCAGMLGSTGQPDSLIATQCGCSPGFIWDVLSNACACQDPLSIVLPDQSCYSCTDPLTFSNGTRLNALSCACPLYFKWDKVSSSCICDPITSITIDGQCIGCASIPGGERPNGPNACKCKSDKEWDSVKKACKCTSSKCQCDINSININSVCTSCETIAGSLGKIKSSSECQCLPGFSWDKITNTCVCKGSALVTNGKSFCIVCDKAINAVSQLTPFSCNCIVNHVWNRDTGVCDFVNTMAVTQNQIMKINGVFLDCNGQPNSQSTSTDNFNCLCSVGYYWNDILAKCALCEPIDHTSGDSDGQSCICNAGYSWDIYTFSCQTTLTCTSSLSSRSQSSSSSKCYDCSVILGVSSSSSQAKTIPISKRDTLIVLSDDSVFAKKQATNLLYQKQAEIKCICPFGTLWNKSRKRCYKSTIAF